MPSRRANRKSRPGPDKQYDILDPVGHREENRVIVTLVLISVLASWFVGLVAIIIFMEVRRARLIKRGLPLEGGSTPPGFDVEMSSPPAAQNGRRDV